MQLVSLDWRLLPCSLCRLVLGVAHHFQVQHSLHRSAACCHDSLFWRLPCSLCSGRVLVCCVGVCTCLDGAPCPTSMFLHLPMLPVLRVACATHTNILRRTVAHAARSCAFHAPCAFLSAGCRMLSTTHMKRMVCSSCSADLPYCQQPSQLLHVCLWHGFMARLVCADVLCAWGCCTV